LDIRFITVDRPGHGLSDFQPDRRLLDWPQDISQLADHLGLPEFYICAHSAGGPHALACAHQLPERVIAGVVISGIAPMSRPNPYQGMPLPNQLLARSSRHFPLITRLLRRITWSMAMDDVEKMTQQLMSSIPEADKSLLYTPENVELMVISIREGFRQGYQGVALDDILVNGDWGFDLQGIKPYIDIWHGGKDVNVPLHAGEYLRDTLPNRQPFFLMDQGHFFILDHWEAIFTTLVQKS
jgi:pimeloyl-ACP methyl ester carboxylesterase